MSRLRLTVRSGADSKYVHVQNERDHRALVSCGACWVTNVSWDCPFVWGKRKNATEIRRVLAMPEY